MMAVSRSTSPLIICHVPLLEIRCSRLIVALLPNGRGERARLKHSGNVGREIERRILCQRCRDSSPKWVARGKMLQEGRTAWWKAPGHHLQLGSRHERILRLGSVDASDRIISLVGAEDGESRKA